MSFIVQGHVQGFDHVRAPSSKWRTGGGSPIGATGFSPKSSLFNLQERFAAAPGSYLPQNIVTRVPAGWATNPLANSRPALHPGNGFGGSAS